MVVGCGAALYCLSLLLYFGGDKRAAQRGGFRHHRESAGSLESLLDEELDDVSVQLKAVDEFIIRRHAKAAVMGALVADAACMPLHGCVHASLASCVLLSSGARVLPWPSSWR